MKDDFTFTDVEKIIHHAKRSTVQLWVRDGLIVPKENKTGRGLSRTYSFDNLIEIWVAVELSLAWGMSTDGLKSIFKKPSFKNAVKNRKVFSYLCPPREGLSSGWLRREGTPTDGKPFTSAIQINIVEVEKELKRRI